MEEKTKETKYKGEVTESVLKTKKKSFISEINPHLVKRNFQKDYYIWFGVFDTLLRNKNICSLIKNCKDSTLPLECAAIHLENFEIYFGKSNPSLNVKAFINESKDSVIFLKLYLISKEQFLDILKLYYNFDLNLLKEDIFHKVSKIGQFEIINSPECEYGKVVCVGELDNIMIYSVTNPSKLEVGSPNTDYLRNIYLGLKKTFSPYSEYLIMYYIYRIEGVRNFYTIEQLKECFFKLKADQTTSDKSLTILNSNKIVKNNENQAKLQSIKEETHSPKKDINMCETIKCSTCNPSPFAETPEKDHLNQFNHIFDLHHLPVFDDNTGEFFWNTNETNWKIARDSILKSEEGGAKSISLNHGSLVSLSTSFVQKNQEELELEQKWINFKKDGNSNTFIDELNSILKNFEIN